MPSKLVEELRALAEKQRDQRGDMLTRGYADREIVRAASRIERYEAALQDIADGASDAKGIAAAALREKEV